jgi:hypothetical protein
MVDMKKAQSNTVAEPAATAETSESVKKLYK